jgi:hypothetical protein
MTTSFVPEDLETVPFPAGAIKVHEWFNDDQPTGAVVDHVNEGTRRWFVGSPDVPDIKVWIDGWQYADGHAERYVLVNNVHIDNSLPPGVAFAFIATLTLAADEIDEMASRDPAVA